MIAGSSSRHRFIRILAGLWIWSCRSWGPPSAFDTIVWIDPQAVEDETVFSFTVPVALACDVGCLYPRQNSFGGIATDELSVQRCRCEFLCSQAAQPGP